MSCSEFEKRIYLYRELSATERKITDVHIAQCELCTALALRVVQQQEMINKARSVKPMLNNPGRLTQRIMNAVERKEKPLSLFNEMTSFLDRLFVRYAFSALSILMIALFYIEQRNANQAQPVAKVEIKQGPILNTSAFLKTHFIRRQKKETTISISRYSYYRSERAVKTL